ncbi:kinase-like protein [Westerdykella ornata]|uniref:Kinase-like protein n=1 Tax=Westerdykella ornata TaxID=318751 RepID=A0A6A6JFM5_WESOR|nr:kinase-like protein [Westerdykella ornata]KAF2275351.1 kinase-like protein [Westerdykella ornata]
MTAQLDEFRGLEWVEIRGFGMEPQWTVEPDLDAIKRTIEEIKPSQEIEVNFMVQGAFNKIYAVKAGDETFIMRVSLPIDPRYKTLSEIATLNWISENTSLPVPQVIDYQPERETSAVNFEWILMTRLPGKPLADMWKTMQYTAKKQLVQQIAMYSASVFRQHFHSIGNLFPDSGNQIGRIVSLSFFYGDHIRQDIYRGPFETSRDWLAARLSLHEHDCRSILGILGRQEELSSDEEAEKEDAERTLGIIERLRTQLDRVFPSTTDSPEPTVLLHDDLSQNNILVDENGKLTGVVGWECVSALPLWKACSYPAFLQGPTRNNPLDLRRYDIHDPDTLYWEHLEHYEKTMLRQYFLDEMRRLEPKWIEKFNATQVKRDFDEAVLFCDDGFAAGDIKTWLDELATAEEPMNVRSIKEINESRWAVH